MDNNSLDPQLAKETTRRIPRKRIRIERLLGYFAGGGAAILLIAVLGRWIMPRVPTAIGVMFAIAACIFAPIAAAAGQWLAESVTKRRRQSARLNAQDGESSNDT